MAQSSVLSPQSSSRRRDALAVLVLCLLASLLFADVLFGARSLYLRDLTRFYYPARQMLREAVQQGEFPYWNRALSAGQPMAANPEHEVFYPLTWLILLPSYDFGFRLSIVLHIWIGLATMYALLRSMDLRARAAFLGALAWGLGGLCMSYVNLLPYLFCAAWLPLTCLFARRFLLHRVSRDFALAALFLGLQLLVGEPTTLMQTGLLIGAYALYRGWYERPRIARSAQHVLRVALLGLCGLLAGAVQVLPALDLVRDSARSRPFAFAERTAWSMPWAKLAETIYPNILGHVAIGGETLYWARNLYPKTGWSFLFSIYGSVLVAALAAGGLLVRARGSRFVLLLAATSAVLAAGSHTPLYRWMDDAGILTSTRYPEKFVLAGVFAASVFAAQMLDRILGGDDLLRRRVAGLLAATAAFAALVAAFSFSDRYAQAFRDLWGAPDVPATMRMIAQSRTDWLVAVVRGAVFALLLSRLQPGKRPAWFAALAAAVALDLGWTAYEVNPRMPRRFFDPPPIAATFPAGRGAFRLFHEADWYGQDALARRYFSGAGTGSDYWSLRNGLFPLMTAGSHLQTVMERDYDKTALLPTVDFVDSVWAVQRSGRAGWPEPFLAMSNAWYTGDYQDVATAQRRARGDAEAMTPVAFRETTHYERYWFANQLVTIAGRDDFVKKLSAGGYSTAAAFVRRPAFAPAAGLVTTVRETANTARLEVETFGRAFLYLSVTPHKYWRVELDGRPVTPVIANIGYQGLEIPGGRHLVTMRYRNDLVRAGGAISLVTIVMLAGIAMRRRAGTAAMIGSHQE
jgi:hypothetical protein